MGHRSGVLVAAGGPDAGDLLSVLECVHAGTKREGEGVAEEADSSSGYVEGYL